MPLPLVRNAFALAALLLTPLAGLHAAGRPNVLRELL